MKTRENDQDDSLERKVLKWLATGKTGISSEAMAFTAIGDTPEKWMDAPSDPADFNRCLLLVDQIPEIREHFPTIAALSADWRAITDHWDELETLFFAEVGRDWSKSNFAGKTYDRMKQLMDGEES